MCILLRKKSNWCSLDKSDQCDLASLGSFISLTSLGSFSSMCSYDSPLTLMQCALGQFLSRIVSTLKVCYLEMLNLGVSYSDPICSSIGLQNQNSIFRSDVLKHRLAKSGFHIQIRCAQAQTCKIGIPYSDPMCSSIDLQNWGSIFRSDVLKHKLAKSGTCALSLVIMNRMASVLQQNTVRIEQNSSSVLLYCDSGGPVIQSKEMHLNSW